MKKVRSSHFFERYFPTPKFLRMPAYGIDFSNHSLRLIELKPTSQGIKLSRFTEKKIPEGVAYTEDFGTNEAVKKALVELKKEYHLHFVSVSIPEEKGYLFTITIPRVPHDQIRSSVELQLEENVPIPPTEVVFDFQVLNPDSHGDDLLVSVAAFPSHILERTLDLFRSVGLIVKGFYFSADGTAMSVVDKHDPKNYIIVNLGEKNTGISIVGGGVLQFTSNVNFGTELFTQAIARQLSVTKEEAAAMKKSKEKIANRDAMKKIFDGPNPGTTLRDEINKVIGYWHSHSAQKGLKTIDAVLLCGADAEIPGLADYLSIGLKLPVEIADVWKNTFSYSEYVPPIPRHEALNYTAAIGLARESLGE